MKELVFDIKLKELPVKVKEGGVEKVYKIKEFTGNQRAAYNDRFDYEIKMEGDSIKAVPGKDFKLMSAIDFLVMCFYDPEDKLVTKEVLGSWPGTTTEKLHEAALKLSGMDKKSMETAKNASAENDTNG